MKCTPRYFFSLVLIGLGFAGTAQEPYIEPMPQRQLFVRVGCDVSRFALPLVGDIGSHGLEFNVDGEIAYNWFPVIEIGQQSINHHTDSLHYKMSGTYGRIGLDYNLLKYKHRLDRDIFFIGVRMAATSFNHEAPKIIMSGAWDDVHGSLPQATIKSVWGEGVVGVKCEILKNIYFGLTVRAKMLFSHSKYNALTPYIIPGYGKGYNKFNAGLSYSIMYAIPIRGAGDDGFLKYDE